jgi:O-antigen/teichoic acid export membrane protein
LNGSSASRRHTVRHRFGHALTFQAITAGWGFVFAFAVALILPPGTRGNVATFTAAATLAGAASTLGFPSATLYCSARGESPHGGFRGFGRLISMAAIAASMLSTAFVVVVTEIGWPVILLLSSVSIGFAAHGAQAQWMLMGVGRFPTVTRARIVGAIAGCVAVAPMVAFTDQADLGAAPVIAVWIVPIVVAAIVLLGTARAEAVHLRPSMHRRSYTSYAFRAYPGQMLQVLTSRVDVLLLGIVAPAPQVGLYAFALGVADVNLIVAQGAASVLTPVVAADPSGESQRARRLVASWLGLQLLGSVAVSLGLVIVLRFDRLAEYTGALAPGLILILANLILGFVRIGLAWAAGMGKPESAITVGLATVITMTISVPVLGASWGAIGAAIGAASGYVAGAIVLAAGLRRMNHLSRLTAREEGGAVSP